MPGKLVIERPLSPGENFFRCRTNQGFYYNFASVAAFSRDVTQDLPLLFRALRKSLLDYHVFICNVFRDPEAEASLVRPMKMASFGDLVQFQPELFSPHGAPVPETCLHDLCRTELFHLNVEKPLFKIFVYGTHDVAAAFEHTLFDGVVALYLQEILLENLAYCDDPANSREYSEKYGPAPACVDLSTVIFSYSDDAKYLCNSLPPPLETVMQDLNVDFTDNDPRHYSRVAPEGYPEKWPGRFPASKDVHVAFKTINIPAGDFARVLEKCKQNGVTFTAYLNLIQALVLRPIFGEKHHSLSLVAITLRRFLSPEKVADGYKDIVARSDYRICGMYANMGVPELLPPVQQFSWDHVRAINGRLAQSVRNDRLLSMSRRWYLESSPEGDNAEFFGPALGKNVADAVKISNLGLARFPVYGNNSGKEPWTVNDIVFAQDLAPNAAHFVFNAVSSARGGLNIVMSYFDHRFDDCEHENFDAYPGMLKRLLLEHAGL
ncbi:hypothetical protein METBIDRAFT_40003 [Metschnikowia bicuspidata var. bicuspidata NRRL YB-4993]|uniref:Alcohol acetyltransferase n=1 Tax=Metschnikowia bicuspidata var. bicuspidata NRRL YB-4993 TaxID=869754 RepID=A0A1A0HDH8_9ASCO|nr:hypothetical protein METBIDRAFT_40003 [Metschnikowia bicuspidata var. bicuspidata NRRL YB-4993]OBA22030.1 hypothetical protein METBIDRAFT_40003 [Metschnikowia bicuspidata var. bicuspidata NRRL YB-4993]